MLGELANQERGLGHCPISSIRGGSRKAVQPKAPGGGVPGASPNKGAAPQRAAQSYRGILELRPVRAGGGRTPAAWASLGAAASAVSTQPVRAQVSRPPLSPAGTPGPPGGPGAGPRDGECARPGGAGITRGNPPRLGSPRAPPPGPEPSPRGPGISGRPWVTQMRTATLRRG